MVTALRSFFRFLFQHGQTESDLAGAVPTVPQWRLAEVPKYLTPEEVERVIHACQRDTPPPAVITPSFSCWPAWG